MLATSNIDTHKTQIKFEKDFKKSILTSIEKLENSLKETLHASKITEELF